MQILTFPHSPFYAKPFDSEMWTLRDASGNICSYNQVID